MEAQSMHADVVIIGGGLAGLSAAAYLARAGVSVTLFEKAAELGGRAATRDYEGYHFNRGIHAFYTGGAATQVLAELGVHYSGGTPKHVFALKQGKLHVAPYDALSMLRTDVLDVADKLELGRLFAALPKLNAQDLRWTSTQAWLDSIAHRPRVKQFLGSFVAPQVYTSALDLVSAEFFVAKTQQILKNNPTIYVDGGWQTLVEGLREVAEKAGARIVSSKRVEAVEYQDGQVRGVGLHNGDQLSASAVIIATEPGDAAKLVDADKYPELRQIFEALVPARLACLDVALSRVPNEHYHVVQDLEHPCFMSAQSFYARIAPQGGALIHAFKQLDPRQTTDPHQDERELEALLDAAQPGWREVVVKRFFLPHIEALGMLPLAKSGGYAGRPGPQLPGMANLYLAGDWIGEGFGIDASLGSARQAAQLLLEKGAMSRINENA
ncbi:NAD(P)/FAD-dependent oxidoreductase [Ktedonosporobacter rubrisoli]|uniref:NAD(P)/FAD-dependent oxidoreductase n=1 Tax=Ktedonosporobacter rubrisoli TaxID=2509675 RepID=A0A4V0YYM1_KTERU|nr:NAD(P)/FAD-dependent oxidoreductase [Ktedonosporobacter rubrisoli]QBD76701.1 NAD(P)/FAD-dependent oxidoreductase [Ktedonosporobacter rubrisoli]